MVQLCHATGLTKRGEFRVLDERVKLCLLTSGAQPLLGAREVEALLGKALTRLNDRLYVVDAEDPNELDGMQRKLYDSVLLQEAVIVKVLCKNPPSERNFYKLLAVSCHWVELKNKTFAVTVRKLGGYPPISSMELAASVADGIIEALNGACKVSLETPDVTVRLIVSQNAAVLGIQALRARGDRYRFRSKKFKIFKHPASLTPEDAGVLVNLTGWRSPLLDPFCGSGTIVVEACLRGLEAVGLDVDPNVARGAHLNLALFSCDARGHIVVGDAAYPPFRIHAFRSVATNPPYGRILSTKDNSLKLVQSLLNESVLIATRDAVLVFVLPYPLNLSYGSRMEEYPVRVHGKLTRFFTTVTRRNG